MFTFFKLFVLPISIGILLILAGISTIATIIGYWGGPALLAYYLGVPLHYSMLITVFWVPVGMYIILQTMD